MTGTFAIARRELAAAFGRPHAWVVLALFVGVFALLTLWYDDLFLGRAASLRGPLSWLSVCFVFLVPATTMRTFAEERRQGTWQLVQALPISPTALVVGKWLGAVGVLAAALATTLPWPIALVVFGDPDPGPMLGGYAAALASGAALAAVGVACSAATESQVLAYLSALTASFLPWLIGSALPLLPAGALPLVGALTSQHRVEDLSRGVVSLADPVWFAAVTAVSLRIAVHLLEHRRLA